MAGNCRPSTTGKEASYSHLGGNLASGVYNKNGSLLFNGSYSNDDAERNQFHKSEDYLILKIDNKCNIYARVKENGVATDTSTMSFKSPLKILQHDGASYSIDASNYWVNYQLGTELIDGVWQKIIAELPAGQYRFTYLSGERRDSEWYLELDVPVMIKSNNNYYSIRDEYYNTETKMYEPVDELDFENQCFSHSRLSTEITINNETFRPIDKFDSFKVVNKDNLSFKVSGTKTRSELIVANDDIDISIANNINSFSLTNNQTNSNIKLALSIDRGNTWNAYSDGTLVPLDVIIPVKNYSEMTDEEKENFNDAKIEILSNGIEASMFNNLIFSDLLRDLRFVRFAYVIELQEGESVAELDKLEWNFNAKGRMYKMNDSEVTIDIYEHSVLVTPLIDNSLIKTNVIF